MTTQEQSERMRHLALLTQRQYADDSRRFGANKEEEAKRWSQSVAKSFSKAIEQIVLSNEPLRVFETSNIDWIVYSRGNGETTPYTVNVAGFTCTCEAGMYGKPCWHMAFAWLHACGDGEILPYMSIPVFPPAEPAYAEMSEEFPL